MRALGTETVIDYNTEDVVTAIYDHYPAGVDKALNGVEGESAPTSRAGSAASGGLMVDLTGSLSTARTDVRINREYIVRADGNRLAQVARMIDDGRLAVEIQGVIPFEHAQEALKLVEAKHVRGKLVLEIAE